MSSVYNSDRVRPKNPIEPEYGGTGISTYSTGDILYASNTNQLSKLSMGTSGQFIAAEGGVVTWKDVKLESTGGTTSLVDTGTGPTLKIKGLTFGNGFTINDNTTFFSINIKNEYTMSLIDTQTFTTSGTWTKPANAEFIYACLIGGGGGGGSGYKGDPLGIGALGGSGGNGGGVCIINKYPANLLPASIPVVVGAGGAGGIGPTVNNSMGVEGVNGGDTTFGIFKGPGGIRGYGTSGSSLTKNMVNPVINGVSTDYQIVTVDQNNSQSLSSFPGLTSMGGDASYRVGATTTAAKPGKGVFITSHNVSVSGVVAPTANNNGNNGSNHSANIFGNTSINFGLGGSGGYYSSGSTPFNGGNGGLPGGGGGGGSHGINDVVDGGNGGAGANGYAIILTFG